MRNDKSTSVNYRHLLTTNGSVFILTYVRGESGTPGKIYYSYAEKPEILWREAFVSYNDDMIHRYPCRLNSVIYDASLNLFIGMGNYNFYYSGDGIDWNACRVMTPIIDGLNAEYLTGMSVADNGNVIVVSNFGNIFHSNTSDFSTWSKASTSLSDIYFYGVINDGEYFYAYSDYILRTRTTEPSNWSEYTPVGQTSNEVIIWAGIDKNHSDEYIVKYSSYQDFKIQRLSDLFSLTPSPEQPVQEPLPGGASKVQANGMCFENGRLNSYGDYYVLNDDVNENYPYLAYSYDMGTTWEVSDVSWNTRFSVESVTFSSSGLGMLANSLLDNVCMSDDNGETFYTVNPPITK